MIAGRPGPAAIVLLAALATAAASAQKPAEDPRENSPFVVAYRCDGGDAVAVRYPAFKDARTQPITLSWDGRRYTLHHVGTGSGARYLTRDRRLEWWTHGGAATLGVPGVSTPILSRCETF